MQIFRNNDKDDDDADVCFLFGVYLFLLMVRMQAEFDMLDGETQAKILRRREAEATSERNRNERKFYFTRALFHRYEDDAIIPWVRDCIFQGLVKNYKLKKSGVKLTLDQKHLYDKVVVPVDLAMKRILRQVPLVVVSEVSEKQALNDATKAAASLATRGAKLNADRKVLEEKKRVAEEAKKKEAEAANDDKTTKKKKRKSKRFSSADQHPQDDEETTGGGGGMTKLADMTPLELDQTYMHCFNVFAERMSTIYCRILNTKGDLKVPKHIRIAHLTSFQIRIVLREAEEKCQKSPITALLPLVQFNEKVLVTAARMLHAWEAMEELGKQLFSSFKMKDKTWAQRAITCMSSCLIMKYSVDEKNRHRGEHIAANVIQSGMKGFIVRRKLRRIWEIANKRYEKEYERYVEQQLQEKFLQEEEQARALELKNEHESQKRRQLLQKIGVQWAEAYVQSVTVDSVVIQVNMRIGGKLPLKDYFRNKNVHCAVRLFERAEQVRDMNCTTYAQMSSSASTISDITEAQIGQIEILIEDVKATEAQITSWRKYGSNEILPTTLVWDSTTKLKKSKLMNVYDVHDDGRDLDIATCFVDMKGLDFNACYNAKLTVNPYYNPEADFGPSDTPPPATVAVLEFVTSPNPPRPPHMNRPDIIHFDHAIAVTKAEGRVDELPLLGESVQDDEETDMEHEDGLSVVDRLERFKITQLERKQQEFNNKTAKKGMLLFLEITFCSWNHRC